MGRWKVTRELGHSSRKEMGSRIWSIYRTREWLVGSENEIGSRVSWAEEGSFTGDKPRATRLDSELNVLGNIREDEEEITRRTSAHGGWQLKIIMPRVGDCFWACGGTIKSADL
ncbi:hypothetical protein HAX54_024227 [Datura stramonium]|uniref:Uncharacterized protein n=1 Tax=Datura stramonium TaxID=4076 RepID=A0ABS8UZR1_DATST|nr:hypothetical protein [Datura stramonium]